MSWLAIILLTIGGFFLIIMAIKIVTKHEDSLDSSLKGYYSSFSSVCKKILNFGC
jgi:hypothetical protein